MTLDRLGALPPQRKDFRELPLTRDQSHDAAAPELERDLDLCVVGRQIVGARHPIADDMAETRLDDLFFAGAVLCGGRRRAKRRRAYPGPTQAPFLAYPASARRRGSTDGYSLTHEPPG